MKQVKTTIIFVIICILCCLADNLMAQTITRDAAGNYYAVTKAKADDKQTGNTFTDAKGNVYPVYVSGKGKLYYIRTSKSGNDYRVYIKTEN